MASSNPGPATTTSTHAQNVTTNQARRLIGKALNVSLANSGDAAIINVINSSAYLVTDVYVTNASTDVHTGYLGVFQQAAGAGTAIVSNAALTSNTGSTYVTTATVNIPHTAISGQFIYVNVGTPVASATVDVYVYGIDFSVA